MKRREVYSASVSQLESFFVGKSMKCLAVLKANNYD